MPDAFVYKRFSDPSQQDGDSFRRQTDLTARFAAKHNLTIIGEIEDPGVSAFRGKNAAVGKLSKFLESCKEGRIEPGTWLLVEELDRLSRNLVSLALRLLFDILDQGIVVASVMDERIITKDSINNIEVLLVSILRFSTGNVESEKKSIRLTEKWGEWRSLKRKTAVCPAWLFLNEEGRYEADPHRKKIMQRIFDMAEAGAGAALIAKTLNGDPTTPPFTHINGKKGRKWYATTIHNMLTGKAILGWHQPCKVVDGKQVPVGDPEPDRYPPVITERQWLAVQAQRKTNPKGKRDVLMTNLFQGIIYCQSCGGPLRVKTSRLSSKRTSGRDHSYFVCSDALSNAGCQARAYFPVEAVENAILDHTREYRLAEIFSDPKTAAELKAIEEEIGTLQMRIPESEKLQANREARIAALDPVDPLVPVYEKALREHTVTLNALRTDLKTLEQRQATLKSRIDHRHDAEANVMALRAQIARAEGVELVTLRSKLSQALKSFLADVRFNGLQNPGFSVTTHNTTRTHQFVMLQGKGRAVGRRIEYAGSSYWKNEAGEWNEETLAHVFG